MTNPNNLGFDIATPRREYQEMTYGRSSQGVPQQESASTDQARFAAVIRALNWAIRQ